MEKPPRGKEENELVLEETWDKVGGERVWGGLAPWNSYENPINSIKIVM